MQPPLTAARKKIKIKKSTLILAPNDGCKPKKSSYVENVPIQNLTKLNNRHSKQEILIANTTLSGSLFQKLMEYISNTDIQYMIF